MEWLDKEKMISEIYKLRIDSSKIEESKKKKPSKHLFSNLIFYARSQMAPSFLSYRLKKSALEGALDLFLQNGIKPLS